MFMFYLRFSLLLCLLVAQPKGVLLMEKFPKQQVMRAEAKENWQLIFTEAEFQNLLTQSTAASDAKFVLFKHSTSCSLSASIKASFEKDFDFSIPCYLVNVIENWVLSNFIESYFSIRHESPQIFLVENGKVSYHNSHFKIKSSDIHARITEN